ncbi:MAG: DinB family protein [Gemmatimonadetes bacterium]|nr:DinB family protein [Gemmatimonadota bacterium]
MTLSRTPHPSEYPPLYRRYVDRVPEGDVTDTLERQLDETLDLIRRFAPRREAYRYAPDKWSVRDVVGHVIDSERVFALRLLWIARAAAADQPGFEEEDWAAVSNASRRPLSDLEAELRAVRAATVALLRSLDSRAWERGGTANGVDFTVGGLAHVIAGHELHHRAILEERYLPKEWSPET